MWGGADGLGAHNVHMEGDAEICTCKAHGLEICHRCCVDFKFINDMQREDCSLSDADACAGPGCTKRGKGLKHCARCGRVKYCGRTCQVAHWRSGHKQVRLNTEIVFKHIDTLQCLCKRRAHIASGNRAVSGRRYHRNVARTLTDAAATNRPARHGTRRAKMAARALRKAAQSKLVSAPRTSKPAAATACSRN